MSNAWLLLIDGYNVLAPVAPPRGRAGAGSTRSDWLHRERMKLVRQLAGALPDSVRAKTCIVFDAANPPRDRPNRYTHESMSIRFAVGYDEADDLLEEMIRAHHTPKRLMVVSSDHRVQTAARRRGASTWDSEPWIDSLLDGRIRLAIPIPGCSSSEHRTDAQGKAPHLDNSDPTGDHPKSGGAGQGGSNDALPQKKSRDPQLSADEVDQWLEEFGFEAPDP